MKTARFNWVVLSAVTVLAVSAAQGQDETSQPQSQTSGQTTTQGDIRYSKLKDAKITTSAGESLGDVEDLLINPTSGKIDFVVLGKGGFLGLGEKRVPVPWNAISLKTEKQFTLNVDKNKLKSAPTLDKDYSELASPDYTVTIYRFYEIPVGGSEGPGSSQQGQGQSPDSKGSSSTPDSSSKQQ
jgi:sporulation protein YlmC with PRC-barrel domain